MLGMEDLLCELSEDINEQGLPPGFRFHPSDEELITFYLASKVFHGTFSGVDIAEVDLNRCEPWELPDVAKIGGEREWYFFSLRDRKYPTGVRTNRATGAGYWKATGKDREVYSSSSGGASSSSSGSGGGTALLIGMKKTLVFYKGRAPRGQKTKWVMHEYRLDGDFSYRHTYCKEEWVICRIFHKIGEKKNPVFQGQSYLFEAASSPTTTTTRGSLPPLLLETASTTAAAATTLVLESQSHNPMQVALQNHFLIPHDYQDSDDLKSLINPPIVSQAPHAFPINGLQPSFSTITTAPNNNKDTDINNPSPSILLKSLLLSHQGCTLKEQATIPKQCKTEANFSLFQLPDANLRWVDKIHHDPCHANPFLLGTDCCAGVIGFSSAAPPDTAAAEVSASMAFNRAGFQTFLVDPPPIRSVTGESWPSDL